MAKAQIDVGHYDSEGILKQLESIQIRRAKIQDKSSGRRQKLVEARQLHLFLLKFHEVSQTNVLLFHILSRLTAVFGLQILPKTVWFPAITKTPNCCKRLKVKWPKTPKGRF